MDSQVDTDLDQITVISDQSTIPKHDGSSVYGGSSYAANGTLGRSRSLSPNGNSTLGRKSLAGSITLYNSQATLPRVDVEQDAYVQMPNDYLCLSLLGFLMCLLPFGAIACYYSKQVRIRIEKEDLAQAEKASRCACKFATAAIIAGIITVILIVAFSVALS